MCLPIVVLDRPTAARDKAPTSRPFRGGGHWWYTGDLRSGTRESGPGRTRFQAGKPMKYVKTLGIFPKARPDREEALFVLKKSAASYPK